MEYLYLTAPAGLAGLVVFGAFIKSEVKHFLFKRKCERIKLGLPA